MGHYISKEQPIITTSSQFPSIEERKQIAQKRLEYLSNHSTTKHFSTPPPTKYTDKQHEQYIKDLLN